MATSERRIGIYFIRGSEAEFKRLMKLFMQTEVDWYLGVADDYWTAVQVFPAMVGSVARLSLLGYYSYRLERLVNLALKFHQPYKQSSVTPSVDNLIQQTLNYSIKELVTDLPRARMNAETELRTWLESIGEDPAEFMLEPAAEKLIQE